MGTKLILDELEHGESMLKKNKFFIKELCGTELLALAKYNKYVLGFTRKQNEEALDSFCKKTCLKYVPIFLNNKIQFLLDLCDKKKPRVFTPIPITESEYVSLKNIQDDIIRKVSFSMLVLAKFFKFSAIVNRTKNVKFENDHRLFYNNSMTEAFYYAGLSGTKRVQHDMMYNLQHDGIVDVSYRGNYEIMIYAPDDSTVFTVDYVDSIKLYYQQYFEGVEMTKCSKCGRPKRKKIVLGSREREKNLCHKCAIKDSNLPLF